MTNLDLKSGAAWSTNAHKNRAPLPVSKLLDGIHRQRSSRSQNLPRNHEVSWLWDKKTIPVLMPKTNSSGVDRTEFLNEICARWNENNAEFRGREFLKWFSWHDVRRNNPLTKSTQRKLQWCCKRRVPCRSRNVRTKEKHRRELGLAVCYFK